jgi:gamma-glutamyltranspeptidase/glutathione hydrolase
MESETGVVAANPAIPARIGNAILADGGNAMDAAVATALACCMVRPSACGIGGYVGAALVRDGKTGKVWSVDGNGPAPAAAHPALYEVLPRPPGSGGLNEKEYFCTVKDDANLLGPLAVAVPGQMAAMGIIHERWGRLPWAQVVAPSQRLLSDGFPFDDLARSIRVMEVPLRRFPASVAHLMPGGRLPNPDEIFHRPDMERTLARLAQAGWRDFYEGELGRTIATAVTSAGGILSGDDMAGYHPRVTDPLTIHYHGAQVHGAILGNGSLSALQGLLLLSPLKLPSEDTVEYWHLLTEVLKLAWRDRLRYLADPRFAPVPQDLLLDPGYNAGRVATLQEFPKSVDIRVPDLEAGPGAGTTHLSSADREGNLVSLTISQGNTFGSCFTVPGTGIVLGHGMCRLDPRPGRINSVAGGKCPLNNTSPMLISLPDRQIAIGLPGGRMIISSMVRAAQLLVDRGYSPAQAAAARRLHVTTAEPLTLEDGISKEVSRGLTALGHSVNRSPHLAGVMNGAEFIPATGRTRAGSGESVVSLQTDYRQMGASGGL